MTTRKPVDSFTIITFSGEVMNWDPVNGGLNQQPAQFEPFPATEENKNAAIMYVLDLEANGATNINADILAILEVARSVRRGKKLVQGVACVVVFLSNSEATIGEISSSAIKNNVPTANSDLKLPIFSVVFGRGADFSLLQDISATTDSFTKCIFKDSNAALQLENFYSEISRPC